MAVVAAQHRLTRLAFGSLQLVTSATPPGAPDTAIAATAFDTGARNEVIDLGKDLGGLGTFSHFVDNTRQNIQVVQPSGEFIPSIAEWGAWLEYLMNGTPSGSGTVTYPLGTVSKHRQFSYDRTDQVFDLFNVVTSGFDISAEAGAEVKLAWRGVGVSFSGSGTFPASPTAAYLGKRFLMGDAAVTLNGTGSVKCKSIQARFDYGINGQRFYSSFTTATPMKTDHDIQLRLELPLREHWQLHDAGSTDTGCAVAIAFTYGGLSLTLNFPAVRAVAPPPGSRSGDPEIILPWEGRAYNATGVTTPNSECTIVLDAVP